MAKHFYDDIPEPLRDLTIPAVIDRFEAGGAELQEAIQGLTDAQLDAHPVPGTWSIREIVCHLMDTDLIAAYRMKRVIAEDRPAWDMYDENAFAANLDYAHRDVQVACEVFRLNRVMMASLLRGLPEAAFTRAAEHAEVGEITLDAFLRLYTHHLRHHLAFVKRKREMVGE